MRLDFSVQRDGRVGWTSKIGLAVLVLAISSCASPNPPSTGNRVILIGVDAGDLSMLRELTAAGELPNFARILRMGAVGHLASIYAELPFSPRRGGGYWSPLVWTSIVTGKEPKVHGIIDFRLPYPDEYTVCTQRGVRGAELELPRSEDAVGVRLRIATVAAPQAWSARLPERGEFLALPETGELVVDFPPAGETSGEETLRLEASDSDPTPLCLKSLDLIDPNGNVAAGLDFVAERARFVSGWAEPNFGKLRGVGTDYRRVRAIWNILSESGKRVAVVGWRDSWPAERVNGTYISDRLGWRPARRRDLGPSQRRRLTFPEDLAVRVRPLVDRLPQIDGQADGTVLSVAPCQLEEQAIRVGRLQYSADWLRHTLALEVWDAEDAVDFLAVYYGGIDAYGHMFLRDSKARETGCPIEPPLVNRYYRVVDEYLGQWLNRLDSRTTLLIVTDHGMVAGEMRGEHVDNGFVILVGRQVQGGTAIVDAHILDVTPTILYLMGFPLALDMSGEPLWRALVSPPEGSVQPLSVATYEIGRRQPEYAQSTPEEEAELLEQLRALGYIN